ncbi:alkaline phosphatase D family protein [Opitutales bacterium ASA1]|uniref:alkaline phosphatase D family protein n=1 Tax=Congregicoccus parvus TaxID=3081749 RepID=UPI002B28F8C2|nr:alkaline phosphatase D family protein [Opitutales bacterium ASA1]
MRCSVLSSSGFSHLRVLAACVAAFVAPTLAEAAGRLVSGPMLGHRAHREVTVWLETEGAQNVEIHYWREDAPENRHTATILQPPATPTGGQPIKAALALLDMGARYAYQIAIDGTPVSFPYPLRFSTTDQWEWRKPPPDFSFLYGSCAYINEPAYDRPGKPYGHTTEIFRHMAASGADFTLWGGDNWYYREADFSSVSGLWHRARHDRATHDLQPLLAAMHHYATWDDHDYGSNDANRSFEFKGPALDVFKAYWGNPSFGEPDNAGVYHKFFWGDAAFIVMDNRYHRDDSELDATLHPHKTQYGSRQVEWLEQSLLQAKQLRHYPFKFVVTGGQVLTSFGGASETFALFPDERARILRFIRDHDIPGVVFLSGDVHFTELARTEIGGRAVYELTSSPLTSGAWSSADRVRGPDPLRVEGTLFAEQNFCRLAVTGPRDARVLTIQCFDSAGALRWTHDIAASELQ